MNEKYEGKIKGWKHRYGPIFSVKINSQDYIYRMLNVGECEKVFGAFSRKDEIEAEDAALVAVLYPEDFDSNTLNLTEAQTLAKYVIDSSNIFRPEGMSKLIEGSKERLEINLQNDIYQWKLSLLSIFNGYTMPTLNQLSIPELFDMLVLAEHLTGNKLINYDSIEQSNVKQNTVEQEKLSNIDTSNVASAGGKFMSKGQLDEIAADQATKNLQNHWIKHKTKR